MEKEAKQGTAVLPRNDTDMGQVQVDEMKKCKHRWITHKWSFVNQFSYYQICERCGAKRLRKFVEDQFQEMG